MLFCRIGGDYGPASRCLACPRIASTSSHYGVRCACSNPGHKWHPLAAARVILSRKFYIFETPLSLVPSSTLVETSIKCAWVSPTCLQDRELPALEGSYPSFYFFVNSIRCIIMFSIWFCLCRPGMSVFLFLV